MYTLEMDAQAGRDTLIRLYYGLGMHYRDIVDILALKHGLVISKRHLARLLKSMGLGRRRYGDIANVILFIERELGCSGALHGYRWMYQKCIDNGLQVRKEDVRLILAALSPDARTARQAHRLTRRTYYARGPNFIWHLDSYDKIKPFGFCINGCIDGFSRKIIWLHVYSTNSDPQIIGGYYMDKVSNLGGCPKFLRGDLGTENVYVREFQRLLRGQREEAYLEGM